ncbi:DUF2779 domain-containing protein [Jezberella montanilacus]|nr:DUF2779 domain-containing protein [Jezberella montanilacus]
MQLGLVFKSIDKRIDFMANPRFLTKSRFKLAAECPTKLFYASENKIYRSLKNDDSFLAMLAEGGFQVGELAKCFYPHGVEVSETSNAEAVAKTNELLQVESIVIFEAAIAFENLFIRVDILVKNGNHYELIEVKAKSYDSYKPDLVGTRGGIVKGMRPYIEDVAFQSYVFKQAFPQAQLDSFLMMPDKSVAVDIDGLNQYFKLVRMDQRSRVIVNPEITNVALDRRLLAKVNVDSLVNRVMEEGVSTPLGMVPVIDAIRQWSQACLVGEKIDPTPGGHCGKCEFKTRPVDVLRSGLHECWAEKFNFTPEDFAKGTVLDLWNFRGKDRMISEGRVRIQTLAEHDLNMKDGGEILSWTERQWMQAHGIPKNEDKGGFWIAEAHIKAEMSNWKYPYHFIDFETSAVAIPFHRGMRPYEQIAFQFSHHMMHEDGRIEHAGQFLLAEPGLFPNFEFIRALKEELDKDNGTVFMWSHHENTILTRIAEQLENYSDRPSDWEALKAFAESLLKTGDRPMFDLCKLATDAYYHVDTNGRSSIKMVLPAVLNSTPSLQALYGRPIYGDDTGRSDGMPSLNYKNFTWCKATPQGSVTDPYEQLRQWGSELLGEEVAEGEDPDDLVIAEGGAAATAYQRLQMESLSAMTRDKIKNALLRYCELDTLAMVMVVQGWNASVHQQMS